LNSVSSQEKHTKYLVRENGGEIMQLDGMRRVSYQISDIEKPWSFEVSSLHNKRTGGCWNIDPFINEF